MNEKGCGRLPAATGGRVRKEIRAALLRRGAREARHASSRGSAFAARNVCNRRDRGPGSLNPG